MATTGPETSSIAFSAASRGDRPSSMWRSTHSTTTIASSTTSPIARIEPEQREGVDGEPEDREEDEGADERHRHRQHRDQRRAPALQEDEHHQDDQEQRLPERGEDLVHARGDGAGGVEGDRVVEVGRKVRLEFGQLGLDAVGGLEGVRAGKLIERQDRGGFSVQAPRQVVGLHAEFDARHVLHPHHRAVGVGAQHDLAELLRRQQPPLREDGVRELLSRRPARRRSGRRGSRYSAPAAPGRCPRRSD